MSCVCPLTWGQRLAIDALHDQRVVGNAVGMVGQKGKFMRRDGIRGPGYRAWELGNAKI